MRSARRRGVHNKVDADRISIRGSAMTDGDDETMKVAIAIGAATRDNMGDKNGNYRLEIVLLRGDGCARLRITGLT
jgi:hypothetical protein